MRWISLTLFSLLVMPVWADFSDGVSAYQRADYTTAVREFTAAARLGDVSAQYNLGFMYATGQGVAKNYHEAFFWFLKAAKRGDSESQFHVGGMYENGLGVHQNYSQAIKWYRKTAEQGLAVAQLTLGGLYGIGLGAPQSYSQAYAWFSLAANQGNDSALQAKQLTEEVISPQQINAAQLFSQSIAKKYIQVSPK